MKTVKRLMVALLAVVLMMSSLTGMAACSGGGIVIYVDGGGANGNFNTTASMEQSPENPYPYNTLEKLAEEYMADHPDVEIVINRTSLNSDRETTVSLLSQAQAPHLLFTETPDLMGDVANGYYVDLTEYLGQPNPYCADGTAGSGKWSDIYNEKELLATQATNGHYYSICLEKIPIGIIYNKSIFADAGLTEVPETFGELLDAQKAISENTGKIPYFPIYDWYDIFLEVSIFSHKFDEYDVLIEDGFVSDEELVRAYVKGLWGISPNPTTDAERMYKEYVQLIKQKSQYYPVAYESYDALSEFLKGNVGMIEATGGYMMQIYNDTTKNFEVDVFGFPTLSMEDSVYGGNGVYRGTAGLTTAYYVTNAAVNDGPETVEACVDFLRFLTAPQNNERLINDLGLGLPLSSDAEVNSLFQPLVEMYNEDLEDPNRYDWNSFCSWNGFGKIYMDEFLNNIWAYQVGKMDLIDLLSDMQAATVTVMESVMETNGWTESTWN